jgi:hypothetical protein
MIYVGRAGNRFSGQPEDRWGSCKKINPEAWNASGFAII